MLRAIVGRLQDALADCDEALKQQPGDAFALDGRAFANLKLGNLDAAISGFDAALKANPNLAISLLRTRPRQAQEGRHRRRQQRHRVGQIDLARRGRRVRALGRAVTKPLDKTGRSAVRTRPMISSIPTAAPPSAVAPATLMGCAMSDESR